MVKLMYDEYAWLCIHVNACEWINPFIHTWDEVSILITAKQLRESSKVHNFNNRKFASYNQWFFIREINYFCNQDYISPNDESTRSTKHL